MTDFSKSLHIIGIDPGKLTGVVSFQIVDDKIEDLYHAQMNHQEVGHLFEDLEFSFSTVVACETYVMTDVPSPWSLETIGLVRYFVEDAGLQLHMCQQSAHKNLIKNDVLKKAGLWFPGEDHARDAARVALFCAIKDYKRLTWTLKK